MLRLLVILMTILIIPTKSNSHELELWQMGAAYKTYASKCRMDWDDLNRFGAVLNWEQRDMTKDELRAYKKAIKDYQIPSDIYSCEVLRDQLYFIFFGNNYNE